MNDSTRKRPITFDCVVRWIGVVLAVGSIVAVAWWADPARGATEPVAAVERIFFWSFIVFAVGLCEMFVLLVALAILGRVDLARAFQDKAVQAPATPAAGDESSYVRAATGSVSLSRLQAFLWTLIILVIYFHEAVMHDHGELPRLPPELLMVMGISSAVYLASKQMEKKSG